jgi:hypothetical protein
MYQLTQLAADQHRRRLAAAEAQRPAERALALARATRRAESAEARMRRAARQAQRLRGASPDPDTAHTSGPHLRPSTPGWRIPEGAQK